MLRVESGVLHWLAQPHQLVSELDLLPTLIDVCKLDSDIDYQLHGHSIAGLLRENPDISMKGRDYIFAEISNRGPLPNDGLQERSVFDGRWKLIYREKVETRWRQVNADTRLAERWGNRTYAETIRLQEEFPQQYRILAEMDPQNLGGDVPRLELYDLQDDPDELKNLVAQPSYRQHKECLLGALRNWAQTTEDTSINL